MNPQALLTENRQLKNENVDLKQSYKKLQVYSENLEAKTVDLEAQLEWLKRQLFGKRSEKIISDKDIEQLQFEGFEIEKPEGKISDIKPHKRKKPKGGESIRLPADLPIEKHVLDVAEEEKTVDGKPLKQIGEEITSKLAYKPGSYYIKQYVRPKYADPEGGIKVHELPETILPRCKADESFIAHIITQKFADHLPLYRISEILQRGEIHISRKVLSRWVCQAAESLKPLHEALNKKVLATQNIFADETPLAMLKPGNQKVHQGYMWVIAGGTNGNPEERVYHFRTSREHKHIQELLKSYRGNLHSDKYGSYEKMAKEPGITWMPCWSHIRRKFFEARPSEIADEYLDKIRELFMWEELAWEQPSDDRLTIRKDKQEPIIDELIAKTKYHLEQGKQLPKSKLYGALGYLRSLTPHLKNYLTRAEARLDNNVAERAIRPIAIGRKNWLFVGSEGGGEAAAILLTLVQTCRSHGINPEEYLEDVMRRLMSHNSQKVHELLPDEWAKRRKPSDTS